jgi:thiamine-monophosphate kinase
MLSEFDLIKEYFQRPHRRPAPVLGIGDDCALLAPTPGMQLAVSSDMLVEGRHFFAGADPFAPRPQMPGRQPVGPGGDGRAPVGFTLALALPSPSPTGWPAFRAGACSRWPTPTAAN